MKLGDVPVDQLAWPLIVTGGFYWVCNLVAGRRKITAEMQSEDAERARRAQEDENDCLRLLHEEGPDLFAPHRLVFVEHRLRAKTVDELQSLLGKYTAPISKSGAPANPWLQGKITQLIQQDAEKRREERLRRDKQSKDFWRWTAALVVISFAMGLIGHFNF